jgi:predicted ATPase
MNTFALRKKQIRTVRNAVLCDDKMKLNQITIQGFKSFDQEGATIRFGDVTVLLGANGVGKSNVVSFFKMLNFMAAGAFQTYVAEQGFAESIAFFGTKRTDRISFELVFQEDELQEYLAVRTVPVRDFLIIWNEQAGFREKDGTNNPKFSFDSTPESILIGPNSDTELPHKLRESILHSKVFHFHDTSSNSKIRTRSYMGDNQSLNHEAGNLAAFLYALKENPTHRWHYDRIVRQIKQAMPQFGDFDLHPDGANPNYIALNWRDNSLNPDYLFGPHQISDGSLRFMALTTLLLQPKELLPKVIVLDEPELGLHPSALAYLGGMIHLASQHCQVVLATQSQRLVDEFEVENIVILERDSKRNATVVSYKSEEELAGWLERYSLSELWEKNVIGGQP